MTNSITKLLVNTSRAENGCWLWLGAKNQKGYGRVCFRGKVESAHRIVYQELNGNITDGLQVLHTCNNPSCVNPDHLRLGNNSENQYDRYMTKGGSQLNEETVKYIRELYSRGKHTQAEIARLTGINYATIHYVVRNKTWRRVS